MGQAITGTPGVRAITGATTIYGILGHPVSHSLSPAIHNTAFAHLGLNCVYVAFPVSPQDLGTAVRGLAAAGVRGFNITVPHKTAIIPFLDEISLQAEAIGAVNTVKVEDGRLMGENTDGLGFVHGLHARLGWSPAGKSITLLGAGGSARAVAMALLAEGADSLLICNRTPQKAKDLAARCGARFPQAAVRGGGLEAAAGSAPHLLVNTTTVGMAQKGLSAEPGQPVDLERVNPREGVVDIIYSPPMTPLLARAQTLGLAGVNGLPMLLYQAAAAFEFWTGREPPVDIMEIALNEALNQTPAADKQNNHLNKTVL
ncbi:MAG: shikimate dehydrogenase [Deltaproteobacteria bacterium]|nr:shikimate dehydrogenase [Deltaproteobacteria bacterium]